MPYEITSQTVYQWFRRLAEKHTRMEIDKNIIHVSDVAGCLLRSFWRRMEKPRFVDAQTIITMLGNGIHFYLQDLLKDDGWLSEVEARYDFKKFVLVGHADLYHPRHNIVVELKTTGTPPTDPYEEHVMQINAYIKMLGAEKGYIVYIGRNGAVKVFRVTYNRKLWSNLVRRAFYLWHCLQERREPKPEPKSYCRFCEYKWRCARWGAYETGSRLGRRS